MELRDLVGSHSRASHMQGFIQHFVDIMTNISAILLVGLDIVAILPDLTSEF